MDMIRITARWDGFRGSPGYSNFFFAGGGGLISDANQCAQRVREAFEEISTNLTGGTDITIESEAAIVDSDSGEIQGFQALDELDPVEGSASGSYSGGSGAVINWRTDDVRFGRRIRGRTFLVPLGSGSYESNGTLNPVTLTRLNAFASTLTEWDFDSEFGVWSRPRNGAGGVFASVTSYNVPDMAAILRSRRD